MDRRIEICDFRTGNQGPGRFARIAQDRRMSGGCQNEPKVNLKKIMDKQGQVGEMSIEDISIALEKLKVI